MQTKIKQEEWKNLTGSKHQQWWWEKPRTRHGEPCANAAAPLAHLQWQGGTPSNYHLSGQRQNFTPYQEKSYVRR